ncbi:MAG: RNA methyltransferase [Pirellulales bacterium]
MHRITSSQNPRIKAVVRLRDSRARRRHGSIVVDGARELLRAVEAGVVVEELFWCPEWASSEEAQAIVSRFVEVQEGRTSVCQVTPGVFEKLAYGERTDGIVGVVQGVWRELSDLVLSSAPLVVVVEGVEKPGNLGAILRSADGAGVSAVVLCDGGTDWYNPNVIRASLGTVFSVPVCAASAEQSHEWLRQQGLRIYAARVEGAKCYWEVEWTGAVAIVLGAESTGLSATWRGAGIEAISLPMCGVADSLNVSATAAVLCYEALRQRRQR